MRKVSVFLYSLTSYLLFMGVFVYLIGFLLNFMVPKSVDQGEVLPLLPALFVDLGLILLFGLQHSLMARPRFKTWLMKKIPLAAERSTYVFVSTLMFIVLIGLWQPIPIVIWNLQSLLGKMLMIGLYALGILGILVTSFQINHFDFLGVRQGYLYLRGQDYYRPKFVKSFLYRWVRHPMHTATIIFFFATPRLTLGHLILALGMTIYALVGIHYEERDLERSLGDDFRAYRQKTPSLLPIPIRLVRQIKDWTVTMSKEQV